MLIKENNFYSIYQTSDFCFVIKKYERFDKKLKLLEFYFKINKNYILNLTDFNSPINSLIKILYKCSKEEKIKNLNDFYIKEKSSLRYIQLLIGLFILEQRFLFINKKKIVKNDVFLIYEDFIRKFSIENSFDGDFHFDYLKSSKSEIASLYQIKIFKYFNLLHDFNSNFGIKHFLSEDSRYIRCNFSGLLYMLLINKNIKFLSHFNSLQIKQIQTYLYQISLYLVFARTLNQFVNKHKIDVIRTNWYADIFFLYKSINLNIECKLGCTHSNKSFKAIIDLLNNISIHYFYHIFLTYDKEIYEELKTK